MGAQAILALVTWGTHLGRVWRCVRFVWSHNTRLPVENVFRHLAGKVFIPFTAQNVLQWLLLFSIDWYEVHGQSNQPLHMGGDISAIMLAFKKCYAVKNKDNTLLILCCTLWESNYVGTCALQDAESFPQFPQCFKPGAVTLAASRYWPHSACSVSSYRSSACIEIWWLNWIDHVCVT